MVEFLVGNVERRAGIKSIDAFGLSKWEFPRVGDNWKYFVGSAIALRGFAELLESIQGKIGSYDSGIFLSREEPCVPAVRRTDLNHQGILRQ